MALSTTTVFAPFSYCVWVLVLDGYGSFWLGLGDSIVKAMFTLPRIRFYLFSYQSVLHVHTAPDTFENSMYMIYLDTIKQPHYSALDKKGKRHKLVYRPSDC